jgi:DNA-binding transcriptional ArsR family regulator
MGPTRARVIRFLEAASEPVALADIARATGRRENNVRYHLGVLQQAGLVGAEARPTGGRGRPHLVFRLRPPPGGPYERLARALLRARTTGETLVAAGAAVAPPGDDVMAFLEEDGFDPRPDGDAVMLGRCPLATAVATDPAAVRAVHLGLLNAMTTRSAGPPSSRPAGPATAGSVSAGVPAARSEG